MTLASRRLPMFPLGSVLVPTGVLPLHIFEMRYRAMFEEVLNGAREFGVVLITRGSEVGGGEVRSDVGTVAQVAEHQFFDDGRLALIATGSQRIEVIDWLPDDPYPSAEVVDLVDLPWSEEDDEVFNVVRERLRRVYELTATGTQQDTPKFEFDEDRLTATWQMISAAPLGPLDKQRLLVQSTPADRLADLGEALKQTEGDLLRAAELDDQ